MNIPPLSEQQMQTARKAATEARRRRAEVKEQLRSGAMTLDEVLTLAETDKVVANARVVEVLKSLPRVGEKRAAELMERLNIAEKRKLGGLGRHQLAGLRAEFGPRKPGEGIPPADPGTR